jgi:hypothetical protein
MIKGGDYVGARTMQPFTVQTHKRRNLCGSGRLCAVASVVLQCIPCFYEYTCMSDAVFTQLFNLMAIQAMYSILDRDVLIKPLPAD